MCHESSFMHQLLMHENVLCYRKDEDWPLGFALQDVIPNHHKLLWSKTTVVNVMGKGEAVTSSGVC